MQLLVAQEVPTGCWARPTTQPSRSRGTIRLGAAMIMRNRGIEIVEDPDAAGCDSAGLREIQAALDAIRVVACIDRDQPLCGIDCDRDPDRNTFIGHPRHRVVSDAVGEGSAG